MIKRFFEFTGGQTLGERLQAIADGAAGEEQRAHIMETIVKPALAAWERENGREIDPHVSLANAVDNVIGDRDRADIRLALDSYLARGTEERRPAVSAAVVESAGRGVFHSFLKALTALGQKDRPMERQCPEGFLLYQLYEGLDPDAARQVLGRFRSLENLLGGGEVLYMGVTLDAFLEYGKVSGGRQPLGRFRLGKAALDWIGSAPSKSIAGLAKELSGVDAGRLRSLCRIKADMAGYLPGNFGGERSFWMGGGYLTFGYRGVGRWDNGELDRGELENLRQNFVAWLMRRKWSDEVLISVKPGDLWLYIHIKPKGGNLGGGPARA